MKNPVNRIAQHSQYTMGIEGHVYDGADGSQMAFWTCRDAGTSSEHVHDHDEYMLVVEGGSASPRTWRSVLPIKQRPGRLVK